MNRKLDAELDRARLLKDAEHNLREAASDARRLTDAEKDSLLEIACTAHRLLWAKPSA
jgi:hypothetical protein